MLTTKQVKGRTKTVTRRLGWKFLKPGDVLNACVKCQGLKAGEKIKKLGQIRVVSVSWETLEEITSIECRREGFPDMPPSEFVAMFCRSMNCRPSDAVTR